MCNLDADYTGWIFEERPPEGAHVLMVTGRLARAGLERVMHTINPTDFTYEIRVLDIQVAAWMSADFIAESVGSVDAFDLILVPGKTTGDVDALSDRLGVKTVRGPGCYSELPVFLEASGLEEIDDDDILRPRVIVLGPAGAKRPALAKFIAETYQIPHLSRNALVKGADAEIVGRYLDAGEAIPHNVMAELVRARFMDQDVRRGWVLEAYPETERDVRWLLDMGVQPDIVLMLDLDDETIRKEAKARGKSEQAIERYLESYRTNETAIREAWTLSPLVVEADRPEKELLGDALARIEAVMQDCLTPSRGRT